MLRVARGFSNREIAEQLGISVKTVETHKLRSMEKLGLRTRADIVQFALRRGWLKPD
jgi:two-component system, NarL family, response regulator NreC